MNKLNTLTSQVNDGQTYPANGNGDQTFADLLTEYEPTPLERGQYVTGEVLEVGENTILADVDAKRTAVVPPQDIANVPDEILADMQVGDEVLFYVIHTPIGDEDLLVSLQKGLQYQDWQEAKKYLKNDELLELEVIGHNKGGILVAFGNLRGFIPNSHIPELQHIYNKRLLASKKAKMIGQELPLKVLEVDRERKRLVLSAKEAMGEVRQERLQDLKEQIGETIAGVVTNLVDFGVFVDLDNVEGLVHISEIAWQQVDHPQDHYQVGDEIKVLIQSVDVERERISLSRKALLPNPWQQFAETHETGELIAGEITNLVDFGAFVRVAGDIQGLIHVSEMNISRDSNPEDVLTVGDRVLVRIVNIDPEGERLGLSQRRVSSSEEIEWIYQQKENQD